MKRIPPIAITAGLIGSGVLAWAFAGHPLISNADLKPPLNVLGINHSPYGEVFAMAMQGPISTNFDFGMFGKAAETAAPEAIDSVSHDKSEPEAKPAAGNPSLTGRLKQMLASMDKYSKQRTNPRPASDAQRFHLRRIAEDKLRFAYQLDPAHYGNYASYHFFLTEPAVGTRPVLTPAAARLAQETIDYCLAEENDPRPALTAAAAATNVLHLMFADQQSEAPFFTPAQMRDCLDLLDHCIARHLAIRERWIDSGDAELLSPMRIQEMDDRFSFVLRIRDAAEPAVQRFEKQHPAQVAN